MVLLILFHGAEFRVGFSSPEWFGTEFQVFASIFVPRYKFQTFFSSAEWFETEFREFPVPRNNRNSTGTNQLFRQFRLPRNNFLSEIANPTSYRFKNVGYWADEAVEQHGGHLQALPDRPGQQIIQNSGNIPFFYTSLSKKIYIGVL
jgi:hypothetical protein